VPKLKRVGKAQPVVRDDCQEVLEYSAPFPRVRKGFFLVCPTLPINVWRRHSVWILRVQSLPNGEVRVTLP
jgi:hypothetical protein